MAEWNTYNYEPNAIYMFQVVTNIYRHSLILYFPTSLNSYKLTVGWSYVSIKTVCACAVD